MSGTSGAPYKAHANLWYPLVGTSINPIATVTAALKIATVGSSYQLQDSNGNPWVGRGMTEWSVLDNVTGSFATTEWSDISRVIATQEAYDVNVVRLRLLAGYYNSLSSSAKTAYVSQVVQRLALAKAQGAILMPCLWDGLDSGPSGFNYSGTNLPTGYTNMFPLMQAICAATDNDPGLVWEPVNEPNNITFAQWQSVAEGLVNCLRTSGYKGVIVLDPINWANSGTGGAGFSDTYYSTLEAYDAGLLGSHHQIAFAVHQYWSPSWSGLTQGTTGGWSASTFQGTVLGNTTTHCIFCTELGFDNNAPGNSSTAWSSAACTTLQSLPTTMKNFAGTVGFIQDWVDDNTLFSLSDRTTPTTWGTIFINEILVPNNTAPVETVQPVVTDITSSGAFVQGDVLSTTLGGFSGNPTPTLTIQWARGTGPGLTGTIISGATSSTYTLQAADVGLYVYSIITATNTVGSAAGHGYTGTAVTASSGGTFSYDFGNWWLWGQGQGGPGSVAVAEPNTIIPSETAWSDNFTTPITPGTVTIPNSQNIWGTIETAPASYWGLTLPPGGSGNVAMFQVTPAQVANDTVTGEGDVMAKLFAAWGTEVANLTYDKPANVSGTYASWFYFPSNFAVPATTTDWINLQQFKQSSAYGQDDPMWWVNVASYHWAQQTQSSTPWSNSTRPVNQTDPVMYLNCWGGPIVPMLCTVPLGQWFHLAATVTQGVSIVWTLNGGTFSTAPNSHYPVGPDSSHPYQWIYGIGMYATFAGTIYSANSTFVPA